MSHKTKEAVLTILVVCITITASLLLGEGLIRKLDGYELFSAELRSTSAQAVVAVSHPNSDLELRVREYASKFALAAGVNIGMFDQDPPELLRKTVPPEWAAIYSKLPGNRKIEFFKLWNSQYIAAQPCDSKTFQNFPGVAFVFDPPDNSEHPPYRFIPSNVTPGGLVTNQFGWRGPEIKWAKPPRVIRIAFAGSSATTHSHSYPFSYPELIQPWLNTWAKSNNLNISFETINLGREGIGSPDIAAVVKHEAAAMQPDIVVYYEGGNQFQVGSIVPNLPSSKPTGMETIENDRRVLSALGKYSAVAKRFQSVSLATDSPDETPKPAYDVKWPAGVDEFDPPLNSPNLPTSLPVILKDLETIRTDLEKINSKLIMTSFNWNVYEGMRLDPVRHKGFRDYLDISMYPFRYRDIARLNRFQNRTFKKFADAHGLPFIEVYEKYPTDPDLFNDPVHETYLGVKLRAWLVLQQLIPIIRKDVDAGILPRAWDENLARQSKPPLPLNVRTLKIGCVSVANDPSATPLGDLLSLSKLRADNSNTTENAVTIGVPSLVKTPAQRYAYAAKIATDVLSQAPSRMEYWIDFEAKDGAIQVGILSKNGSRFLKTAIVDSSRGRVTIPLSLTVNESLDAGDIVIANGLDHDKASSASIYSIKIYSKPITYSGPLLGDVIASGVVIPMDTKN